MQIGKAVILYYLLNPPAVLLTKLVRTKIWKGKEKEKEKKQEKILFNYLL